MKSRYEIIARIIPVLKYLLIFLITFVVGLLVWTEVHKNNCAVLNETLPKDDFSRLIDLRNFEFIMNQPPCIVQGQVNKVTSQGPNSNSEVPFPHKIPESSGKPFLLILIHSATVNYQRRMIIRKTWGSWTSQIYRVMFLIGMVESTNLQKSLEMENEMFKDLIQGNFIDTYSNLTYKHVMALKWYIYYCPEAEYLMKTDDDIFVNTPFVVDYLNGLDGKCDILICKIFHNNKAQRDIGKWRITKQEYPETYYPDYCAGFMIIYSRNIAIRLYTETQRATYFWIDDVQITGILRQKANIRITPTNLEPFLLKKIDCKAIRKGKLDIRKILVSRHNVKADQIDCAWQLVQLTLDNAG